MRRCLGAIAAAVCFAFVLVSCTGGSNGSTGATTPTAPTPTTPILPIVTATFTTITGERQAGGGYLYRVIVQVRESAGVAATIAAIDLVFLDGSSPFGSTHFDSPMSGDNNQLAANG